MTSTAVSSVHAGHAGPTSESSGDTGTARKKKVRSIAAATVGCMLEWYDFAVYGYFAVVISKLFFPVESEWVSLLLTVATFGVGFAMRPVGALVLGTLADTKGRRVALSWTIVAMVVGTAIIAFTPTYQSIGIWAPVLMVLARLIQGFSAGGEMGTATSFLVEHAPSRRRFLFASFQQLTQLLALLLGSLIGAAITSWLSPAEVEAWGWRVPFIVGLLIGPVGWYIRKHTEEPPAFAEAMRERRKLDKAGIATAHPSPWSAIRTYPRESLAGFCITVLWTVCTYFFLIYVPTYAVKHLQLPQASALMSNAISLLVAAILLPVFASMADRIGAQRILQASSILILIAAYPAMLVLSLSPTVGTLIAVQAGFAVLIAAYTGPAGGALATLFPADIRATGISIAYNFAVTIFGGFAPFIATWLIGTTGNLLSPAWYAVVAALIAAVGARQLRFVAGTAR